MSEKFFPAQKAHDHIQRLNGRKRNSKLPLFRFEPFTDWPSQRERSKGGLEKDKYKHEVAKELSSFRVAKNTWDSITCNSSERNIYGVGKSLFFFFFWPNQLLTSYLMKRLSAGQAGYKSLASTQCNNHIYSVLLMEYKHCLRILWEFLNYILENWPILHGLGVTKPPIFERWKPVEPAVISPFNSDHKATRCCMHSNLIPS